MVKTSSIVHPLIGRPKGNAEALDLGHDDASSPLAVGLVPAGKGSLGEAAGVLSQLVIREPGNAEAHNNLGLILQQLGRLEEAISSFRRAIVIRPSYVIALTNLGVAHAAQGRHEEAIRCSEAALEVDSFDLSALNNLGAAHYALERYAEAIGCFEAVIALAADFADARINLAAALREAGRPAEAVGHYQRALVLRPDDVDAHLNLADLLHTVDRRDEAIAHFTRASEISPQSAPAHAGLGRILQEVGRIEEARACFRQAVAADPKGFAHYLNLAHITKLAPDDPVLLAMLSLAEDIGSLPDDDRINAHFGLGKALADVGRHDDSFAHFLAGNKLRRQSTDYDEARALRGLQRIKDVFTPEYLARWPKPAVSSATPIFIVGMPRSGSTLVEQILAKHQLVICAGETDALRQTLNQYDADVSSWRLLDPAFHPTDHHVAELSARYLARLKDEAIRASPEKAAADRVTDKMLNNFRYIGLIHKLFPNARIIHTFRDPIETCLSCFSINFANQRFTFNLAELGRYYRGYAMLMRHWKKTLPAGVIFDVRYEAVVQDFERSARAIVAHCALDWDDECLRFYEAERPVRTASVEQVRRPIYHSSVRRWRPDSETLRPLLDGLGWPAGDR